MSSPFVRKLKREVQRSPQKAAALGVLLLVAVWFWLPLLTGSAKPAPPSAPAQAGPVTSAAAVSAPAPVGATTYAWQDLAAAIDVDQRMQPGQPLAGVEPFRAPAPAEQKVEAAEVAIAPPPEITPNMAGLVLTSTIVGGSKRVAVISGKSYRIGDELVVGGKDSGPVVFVLAEVHPRSAVLVQGSHRYELRLKSALIDESSALELTSATAGS